MNLRKNMNRETIEWVSERNEETIISKMFEFGIVCDWKGQVKNCWRLAQWRFLQSDNFNPKSRRPSAR